MGMYDFVGDVQIKCGENTFSKYKRFDNIPLEDGLYLGYEG